MCELTSKQKLQQTHNEICQQNNIQDKNEPKFD